MIFDITISHALLIFISAILAGALNAVAGGGTMFTFPALLFTGMPSIIANATSKIGIMPAAIASAVGYRKELKEYSHYLPILLPVSLIGGWLGAELLLITPKEHFNHLVPWLLLTATLLFAYGKAIASTIGHVLSHNKEAAQGKRHQAIAATYHMMTSVYGGFFGAGIGILMLAMMQCLGLKNIHGMNGLKTILGAAMHITAALAFIVSGSIAWSEAAILVIGGIIGGYYGARIALHLPQAYVRMFVIAVGSFTTAYFFTKYY